MITGSAKKRIRLKSSLLDDIDILKFPENRLLTGLGLDGPEALITHDMNPLPLPELGQVVQEEVLG